MDLLIFIGWILLGFAGMEIVSYLVHRFIFHGLLWRIHRSHHEPTHGLFELNDLFSLFFAGVSVYLIYSGVENPLASASFAVGVGIAVYGMLYFIIHDLFAHKRFMPFKSDSKIMRLIRYAHQRHHQSIDKDGEEPYGLFLFPYDKYKE
ncbi:sterol desaturase family protein [Fodinibius halophilus]|uniref:Fatty acid hydroxylase n=1 Tax=Fodinibius halophilus TaxID=1736908 RepID=A0A6M1TIH2_9BACT|nr:sterol desaturase family protein [Fodinibius halophilus]NGP88390.1 fatty acid hydroxylase [Fodinibius halophilus]